MLHNEDFLKGMTAGLGLALLIIIVVGSIGIMLWARRKSNA